MKKLSLFLIFILILGLDVPGTYADATFRIARRGTRLRRGSRRAKGGGARNVSNRSKIRRRNLAIGRAQRLRNQKIRRQRIGDPLFRTRLRDGRSRNTVLNRARIQRRRIRPPRLRRPSSIRRFRINRGRSRGRGRSSLRR